jgi:HEPN domain-containing protein
MKKDTRLWLDYADENLKSAKILLESHLYNPVLQNTQQAIEKYLKAYFIQFDLKLQKTHNISLLVEKIKVRDEYIEISDDECDLIDSIYMISKYPFGSALPDFHPDENICQECIEIAIKVKNDIKKILGE